MKLARIALSLALLLTGCYTNTVITKDSALKAEYQDLTFSLTNGTYIKSKGGQHIRLENGYEIVGILRHTPQDNWNTLNYQHPDSLFDGIVFDKGIKEVVAVELDVTKTVVAASLGGLFLVGLIGLFANPPSIGSFSLSK
jgi:hypothetical protein